MVPQQIDFPVHCVPLHHTIQTRFHKLKSQSMISFRYVTSISSHSPERCQVISYEHDQLRFRQTKPSKRKEQFTVLFPNSVGKLFSSKWSAHVNPSAVQLILSYLLGKNKGSYCYLLQSTTVELVLRADFSGNQSKPLSTVHDNDGRLFVVPLASMGFRL